MRLGVYGGSFNPIHFGHLRTIEEVRELLKLDEVLFVPAKRPPLKDEGILLDDDLRMRCVRAALEKHPYFTVSTLEYDRSGTSYTLTTIKDIKRSSRLSNGERPFLLVGEAFQSIKKWWNFEELLTETHVVWMSRPGSEMSVDSRKQFVESLGFCYNSSSRKTFEASADKNTKKTSSPPPRGPADTATNLLDFSTKSPSKEGISLPRIVENYTHSSGSELFVVDVTPVHASSTDIRARLSEKRSVRYLVPDAVYNLLMEETT